MCRLNIQLLASVEGLNSFHELINSKSAIIVQQNRINI